MMRRPEEELLELERAGLRRYLRRLESPQQPNIDLAGSGPCRNFSSNDYLGLANSEELRTIFAENILKYGAGSGASRLVCGTMRQHFSLEESLAELKRSEAALTFSSGFAAATSVIPALCGKGDVVILDKLCHASLIDGARLSGAKLRVWPHNDLEKLRTRIAWANRQVGKNGRILIVTESIFSMDGDRAPLREIIEMKNLQGALLLLDEAHAFGVFGPQGRGIAAEMGLESEVDFQMGTFSKAAGLTGGYVCANRAFIDLLVNRARGFIYSTAPSPALAASIESALEIIAGEDGDRKRDTLWERIHLLDSDARSAIIPILMGENETALSASDTLLEKGFLVPAIRYPTVPRGSARLRVTLSAAHEEGDVLALKDALSDLQAHSEPTPPPHEP
ncbi:8-amino-7-oxononanoate synthase [Verrucomicrobiales bacterium]|nr:8-amino-7-oxononanoate synthase [Verrucomicrobiales bacterium]